MKTCAARFAAVLALSLSASAVQGGPPEAEGPAIGPLVEAAVGTDPDAVLRALDGLTSNELHWRFRGIAESTAEAALTWRHWIKAPRGGEVRKRAIEAMVKFRGERALTDFADDLKADPVLAAVARMAASKQRSTDNIHSMLLFFLGEDFGVSKGWPPFSGKRLVLWLVARDRIDRRNPKNLEVLFSPADAARSLEKAGGLAAYDALTIETLRAEGGDFGKFTSYAGRRNREKAHILTASELAKGAIVFADLSFPDGIIAGYSNGLVRWVPREELGLPPGQPIVVGDTSPNEELRHLSNE